MVTLACAATLVAGCFKENPAFKNKDAGPPPDDTTAYFDGIYLDAPLDLVSDDVFSPDVVPWPDQQAWPCTKDAECADKHDCTVDTCQSGKCTFELKPDRCLIGLKCYKAGESPAGNDCQICNPTKNTSVWDLSAEGSPCASDKLSCTTDVCKKGKCTHTLKSKQCLISGKCYVQGEKNPASGCQVCNSNLSTSKWITESDNMPCTGDGLACTKDFCLKGKCTHPVSTGCLINKACVADGQASPTDTCKLCVPSGSKTAYTLARGAPCTQAGGKGGMCVAANTCAGFNQKLFSAKGAYNTVLRAVDYLPDSKKVWAAGMYQETDGGAKKGVLVHATPSSIASEVTASGALNDLHYRMAVGDNGTVMYHDGTKWAAATWLTGPLGTADRLSVWGANVDKALTFYVTGKEAGGAAALTRCTLGSTIACTDHTGVANNMGLGSVFGTLTSAGTQGPLWASVQGVYADPEDIYYNAGNTKTWSTKGPKGCKDQGGTPCGSTSSETMDLEGSSANDVWLVGSGGLILRFDGKAWDRTYNVLQYQSSYTFTAVFSSAALKLTSVVGHYDSSSGNVRRVRMFNYNHLLKRWFGPITVADTPHMAPDVIWDMGGQGYNNLWLVGQRQIVGSSGKPQLAGWMLQLK